MGLLNKPVVPHLLMDMEDLQGLIVYFGTPKTENRYELVDKETGAVELLLPEHVLVEEAVFTHRDDLGKYIKLAKGLRRSAQRVRLSEIKSQGDKERPHCPDYTLRFA